MSRKLAILIVAISASASFAQETQDPVERMTDRIMSRFMPGWMSAEAPRSEEDELTRRERPSVSESSLPSTMRFAPDLDGMELPEFDMLDRLDLDIMPMPRDIPAFPAMKTMFRARAFASSGGTSSSSYSTSATTVPAAARPTFGAPSSSRAAAMAPSRWRTVKTVPRTLALSRASANGIHKIEAVVPTKDGARRLELEGTSQEVRRQVETLPSDVRVMMEEALGL